MKCHMNKQKIYKIKYIQNMKKEKKNLKNRQKKQQMFNKYDKKEKDNEQYLNIYSKYYKCNLEKSKTKEIELNNLYKNLKIGDWFNPRKDIKFVMLPKKEIVFFFL